MSEFTREQIIEAAKQCSEFKGCGGCPLDNQGCGKIKNDFIISLEKEEPAPSANDTSSNNNSLSHLNDTSKSKICQAFESAECVTNLILSFYESMSEAEQRAFDLGEAYGKALGTKNILEELKAGEQECP